MGSGYIKPRHQYLGTDSASEELLAESSFRSETLSKRTQPGKNRNEQTNKQTKKQKRERERERERERGARLSINEALEHIYFIEILHRSLSCITKDCIFSFFRIRAKVKMFLLTALTALVLVGCALGQTTQRDTPSNRLSDQEEKLQPQFNTTYYVAVADSPPIPQLFISDEEALRKSPDTLSCLLSCVCECVCVCACVRASVRACVRACV